MMGTANCINAIRNPMNFTERQQEGKFYSSFLAAHGLSGSVGMFYCETVCEQ
jgi:hypothetical protein